ncbi:16S rRNA (cytosine(1402)-N(4))-methyltransferase RsmH [bacterium]|nr:16S rRNA (cytosine(1402)-N(4))-methyltransferase RsmH [bacterium]
MDEFHKTVLLEEIVTALSPTPKGVYVDATLGGGGHAEALLQKGAGMLIALDMDGEALAHAGRKLACFAERLSLHNKNFKFMDEVLSAEGIKEVDGVVFDLGLSWHQVRSPDRGFSYQGEGKLDMRFDTQASGPTALDIIRKEKRDVLEKIFRDYGEEPFARRIADEVSRKRHSIKTAADLREMLREVVGENRLRKTAMRVFQALRIAVNDELSNLEKGLHSAVAHLAPRGRVAVIDYHSLEARIVKKIYKEAQSQGTYRKVNSKPIVASREEQARNPASRSARLRIIEKI